MKYTKVQDRGRGCLAGTVSFLPGKCREPGHEPKVGRWVSAHNLALYQRSKAQLRFRAAGPPDRSLGHRPSLQRLLEVTVERGCAQEEPCRGESGHVVSLARILKCLPHGCFTLLSKSEKPKGRYLHLILPPWASCVWPRIAVTAPLISSSHSFKTRAPTGQFLLEKTAHN